MVEVEPTNVIAEKVEGNYQLLPYRERRKPWGFTFAVGYSSYEPINYEPNFVTAGFDEVYTSPDVAMVELKFSFKRNLPVGSIGAEIGVGIYDNDADVEEFGESSLQLIPIRVGGVYYMDTLLPEPYIVPYVSGGAYIMVYEETLAGSSFSGNSQVAGYMTGGVAFQLDWLDKRSARIAYQESEIQSTYVFAEAGTLLESGGATDPDFSSGFNWGAGLRVEF